MSDKFKAWTDRAVAQMRFPWDRAEVRKELLAHLEDREYDYVNHGLTKEEAQARALAAMGDAVETGKLLNKAHSPLLGWAWLVSKWVCVGLVIVSLWMLLCNNELFKDMWDAIILPAPCENHDEVYRTPTDAGIAFQEGNYHLELNYGGISIENGAYWNEYYFCFRVWTLLPWLPAPQGLNNIQVETSDGRVYDSRSPQNQLPLILVSSGFYDTSWLPVWEYHCYAGVEPDYDGNHPEWLRFSVPGTDIAFTVWPSGEIQRY